MKSISPKAFLAFVVIIVAVFTSIAYIGQRDAFQQGLKAGVDGLTGIVKQGIVYGFKQGLEAGIKCEREHKGDCKDVVSIPMFTPN